MTKEPMPKYANFFSVTAAFGCLKIKEGGDESLSVNEEIRLVSLLFCYYAAQNYKTDIGNVTWYILLIE